MSGLELFSYEGQQLRVVRGDDGGDRWVAADVAAILNYAGGARNAIARLPERMKGVALVNTPGGSQRMAVLTEGGVNRLIMRAETERAEAIQDWLAEVVMPQLARTGSFSLIPQPRKELPADYLSALKELVSTVERAQVAEAQVVEMAPKALLADRILTAEGDYSVRETAQSLNRDPGISMGATRLFAYLRRLKWISQDGTPLQRQIELGRLSSKPQVYPHPHTDEPTLGKPQVRVTGKGIGELHRLLGGTEPVQLPEYSSRGGGGRPQCRRPSPRPRFPSPPVGGAL